MCYELSNSSDKGPLTNYFQWNSFSTTTAVPFAGCRESTEGCAIFCRCTQDQHSQLSPKLTDPAWFSVDEVIKPTWESLGRFNAHALPRPSVVSSDSERRLFSGNGPQRPGTNHEDLRPNQKQSFIRWALWECSFSPRERKTQEKRSWRKKICFN